VCVNEKEIKCVVWDLDNTIWDGVLTENDKLNLKEGIKEIIQELDSRGILNSIASKNNYEDATKKLQDFGLLEYFLYHEINWNSKSSSIMKISKNLNLALDTFAFIDDQDYELDEVKHSCNTVLCINTSEYKDVLNMKRMNPRFITEDSRRRRSLYLENIERKKEEESFEKSSEQFLQSLNMKLYITKAQEYDLKRAEELTLRSNQLNSTGITYCYEELNEYRKNEDYDLYICELVDRYGSYGKIGLALVDKRKVWHLKLLLVSCRVMSRGIGTVLLNYIMKRAKQRYDKLYADFIKTNRNTQMYIAYKFANFKEVEKSEEGKTLFVNNLDLIQEIPSYIQIIDN